MGLPWKSLLTCHCNVACDVSDDTRCSLKAALPIDHTMACAGVCMSMRHGAAAMQITPIHDRTPCTPSTSGRVPPLKYRSRRCTTNVSETLTRAHLGSPPHRGQRLDISLNAATEGEERGLQLEQKRCCLRLLKLGTTDVPAGSEVYQGAFGEWSVEESDVKEVLGYRAGLSVAALGGPLNP